MIRFKTFILPKIYCGIGRNQSSQIDEKIEVASDIEHAQDEHGINQDQLVDFIKKNSSDLPSVKDGGMRWYEHDAKPINDLYDRDIQRLHDKLTNHYSNYNSDHKKIISSYAIHNSDEENSFRYVNHRILTNEIKPSDHIKMATMDDAINAHRTPEDMHVWSGVSKDHSHDVLTSEKVHHPSYLSTSLDPGVAMSFGHQTYFLDGGENAYIHSHVLKIHVPAGHPGAYIEHSGGIKSEFEFIMPRDTVLRIDHSKRQVHEIKLPNYTKKYFIHHAYPVTEK